MGGYTIEVQAVESAADALSSVAFCASSADSDITGIPALPAPAAGDGIGGALTAFQSAWHDVLPKLNTEVDTLSKKVTSAARVTIQVEEPIRNRFQAFAE